MNLQNSPRCNPFHNGTHFGGKIDSVYTGINGGNNKTDQAKIVIDFELINCRHNPNKSVFSFRKKRSGPVPNGPSGK